MEFEQDYSGINSLRGFSFQIKVFVSYMLDLKDGMQLEFETIEDVNLKKIKADNIDENSENFRSNLIETETNQAIQVKRTTITKDVATKILLNWILLESSVSNVSKYILLTETAYNNKDIIFEGSVEELFQKIIKSNQKNNATVTKVKSLYKSDLMSFKDVVSKIKEKYEFLSVADIDNNIDYKCALHFRKVANDVVYGQRLKELLQHITVEIMDAVNQKKPFTIDYCGFVRLIEDISTRLTESFTAPNYADFKKINQVDLSNSEISKLREYQQLVACNLPDNLLKQHLTFKSYFENTRYRYMETNKQSRIEEIEETTFENFENVVFKLQQEGSDVPFKRLDETKKMPNSHATNEQIRYGCGIYLTKDGIVERQISWEDEQNAKSKV
jgi:hypothetical protein